MQRSGIYCIINHFNNKRYIGQSVHLSQRINNHFSELRHHCHSNKTLQNDYNKYSQYFNWEILEFVEIDKLCEREAYWCKYYNTFNPKYGYNHQQIREQIYTKNPEKYKGIN